MPYRLRDGISCCIASGRVVLFDLSNCRYSALPDEANAAFQASMTESGSSTDAGLTALVKSGILVRVEDKGARLTASTPLPASRSLIEGSRPQPSVFQVGSALIAQADAAIKLKTLSLETIFSRLTSHKATCIDPACPSALEGLARISSAFYWSQRLIASGVKCLRRSIALATYLDARDIPCNLVIGVRMRPFAAHAWVQHGDIVLNETLDEVRRYTTILVV